MSHFCMLEQITKPRHFCLRRASLSAIRTVRIMEKVFKGLGSVTGRFYNTHQEWKEAPEWVKEHYKLEEQQHCGDITTIPSGALQGAVNAVAEFAKQNPTNAAMMGTEIAKTAGIKPEYGLAFASGFLGTAHFK